MSASVFLLAQSSYKPGDPAPEGYLAWHEWAKVQAKAGLKQQECGRCGKWWFPQEVSTELDVHTAKSIKGPQIISSPVCKTCAEKAKGKS